MRSTQRCLFRYYWVLFAFVLATLATAVLIAHMPDVSSVADAVQTASSDDIDRRLNAAKAVSAAALTNDSMAH